MGVQFYIDKISLRITYSRRIIDDYNFQVFDLLGTQILRLMLPINLTLLPRNLLA